MRTVYIEPITFECHTEQNSEGTRIPYETSYFDGKCDAFIEGHRIVPEGCSWTRSDGKVFQGDMIAPCRDNQINDAAQDQYEADLAEAAAAYQEGVESV